jgi:methylmalonyl-CoA mutase
VVLDGFTRAEGRADAFARRQARNTQLVLMEEANLGRVDDPAAGSWFLDHRTRDLAEAGWAEFQRHRGARADWSRPCAAT